MWQQQYQPPVGPGTDVALQLQLAGPAPSASARREQAGMASGHPTFAERMSVGLEKKDDGGSRGQAATLGPPGGPVPPGASLRVTPPPLMFPAGSPGAATASADARTVPPALIPAPSPFGDAGVHMLNVPAMAPTSAGSRDWGSAAQRAPPQGQSAIWDPTGDSLSELQRVGPAGGQSRRGPPPGGDPGGRADTGGRHGSVYDVQQPQGLGSLEALETFPSWQRTEMDPSVYASRA